MSVSDMKQCARCVRLLQKYSTQFWPADSRRSRRMSLVLESCVDAVLRSGTVTDDFVEVCRLVRSLLGTEFVQAVGRQARQAGLARLMLARPRALWGVTPMSFLGYWKDASIRLGFEAETVVTTTYYTGGGFDIDLSVTREQIRQRAPEQLYGFDWAVLLWAAMRYDVFHYYFDRGILSPESTLAGPREWELEFLRGAGKRLYFFPYGADIRSRDDMELLDSLNICSGCPEPGRYCVCDDERLETIIDRVSRYANATFAIGLSEMAVVGGRRNPVVVVDVDALQPEPGSSAQKPEDTGDEEGGPEGASRRPLLVAHASNHRHFKGTEYLERAVEQLQAEGEDIELVCVEGVSRREVLDLFRKADVVAEQFLIGHHGQTAVEAMALGKPVLARILMPQLLMNASCPVIHTAPEAIAETLRQLNHHRDRLAEIGRKGREYVEKYHSVEAFAQNLREAYLETAAFPRPLLWRLSARTLRSGEQQGRLDGLLVCGLSFAVPVLGWLGTARSFAGRAWGVAKSAGRFARRTMGMLVKARGRYRLQEQLFEELEAASAWPDHRGHASPDLAEGQAPTVNMLIISEVHRDPRVERCARALAADGFFVRVICPDYHNVPADLSWGPGVEFLRLPPDHFRFVNEFPYLTGRRLLERIVEEPAQFYHCHDLWTGLVGLEAARRTGAFCIIDNHEWFSENVSYSHLRKKWVPHPWFKKAVYQRLERLSFRRADIVINVCESIAREMKAACGTSRQSPLVRNIPPVPEGEEPGADIRTLLNLPEDAFILLWQGGVGPSRLIEPLIHGLGHAPRVHFVIRGPYVESYKAQYKREAWKAGASGRVHMLPAIPSNRVVEEARSADAGVWTLPNLGKNFYYALPNKLFEYISAGLPVLGAHFPEARAVIEGHGVGLTFDPYDAKSIGRAMKEMSENREAYEGFRQKAAEAARIFDGRREWEQVPELYRRIMAGERF